jgi:hypothetical protein
LPFNLHDFTLVGVWLVAVYGVLLFILAAGLWFGKKWAWMGSRPISSTGHLEVAEVILFYSLGFTFFYPLIGGIGVLTIVLSYLPSTTEYTSSKARQNLVD